MRDPRFERFGLVLMMTHACRLRCSYCYVGEKTRRRMPAVVAARSLERAVQSLRPRGRLELSFFGGEPLLEAENILEWSAAAERMASAHGASVQLSLTTSGTETRGAAWTILTRPDFDLTVSFDGPPEIHDRHRTGVGGQGTSAIVIDTLRRLLALGRELRVLSVVRPDTLAAVPDGIAFLRALGVRQVDLSLDLWTEWTPDDGARLEAMLVSLARLWRENLPDIGINWFDEKLLLLSGAPFEDTARCGFGAGQIAVAPSGRLYPCERLIGEDREENPMRLPGRADEGTDFLGLAPPSAVGDESCASCALRSSCGTDCRCSNYVRTGDAARPDGLLCLLDRVCTGEVARVLGSATREAVDA